MQIPELPAGRHIGVPTGGKDYTRVNNVEIRKSIMGINPGYTGFPGLNLVPASELPATGFNISTPGNPKHRPDTAVNQFLLK